MFRRDLDLLVCEPSDLTNEALNSETLLESAIVAVLRPEHPMCAAPPTGLVGLLQYPIVTSCVGRKLLDHPREAVGIHLDAREVRVICSDFDMLVRVVAASPMFFTVGPQFSFAPDLNVGTLAVIGTALPFMHTVCMHTNRDAYPLPAAVKAQEIIRQLLREMPAAHER